MKNIFIIFFLIAFTLSAMGQEKKLTLPSINNFQKLNNISSSKILRDKNATKTKDFSFTINPYLWTVAMGGTIGVPGIPASYPQTYEFNKSFSDALKNLKMAFMVAGKFKYKRVSLLYNLVYFNLKRFGVDIPQGSGLLSANTTAKELITDLALSYSFPTKSKSTFIDAYAGTRIWSLESEISLVPETGSTKMNSSSKTWIDPIVGIHVDFLLSPKYFSYVRSDFGGFNANSAYNFMIMGGFGYRFSPNFNTSLGLKYLGLDYNKDGRRFNVNQYGFTISLGYAY